ncbi:RNA polymerase sigma factor [Nonomuraea sp. NPDC050547]|uniref:RNA polymerase sigma factor n=1 Tax=Nonomuraea sp. NPDC050547 TaxID=3364368 RepID=UPI0037B7B2EE
MEPSLRVRLRAGDHDAFSALFDEFAQQVYAHAYRLTGDWSTAEDVTAATFGQAWRSRRKIQTDGGTLRPWLLGIATNLARAARRGERRRRALADRLPPDALVPDFADQVADRAAAAAQIHAVRQAFDRLRRPEQDVVALCVWAGLDYEQAAQALGIPVGTVKSRLSRARARLARELIKPERQVTDDRATGAAAAGREDDR